MTVTGPGDNKYRPLRVTCCIHSITTYFLVDICNFDLLPYFYLLPSNIGTSFLNQYPNFEF